MPPPVWNFILTNGGGKRFSPPCVSSPFFSPPLFFPRKSLPHCINNMAPPPQGWGCHVGLPDRIQNPSAAARGGESFSPSTSPPFFFLKLSRMSLTRRKSNMAPPPQGWGCHVGLPDRIQNPSAAARGGESFSPSTSPPFFFLKLSRMSLTRRKSNMAPPPHGWGCHVGLPDRIRTCGLESRSLALYPAGLRVETVEDISDR